MAKKAESAKSTTIAINSTNWLEHLTTLDINMVHKSRTCDVFFMAEYKESCSMGVEKFNKGAKIDQINMMKSIHFDDIITNITKFSQNTESKIIGDILYHYGGKEAVDYLNGVEEMSAELTARLIKLQIVYTINQDVAMTQRQIVLDRDREGDLKNLVQMDAKGKDQKGKGKGKDKKGKDKKGKDSKSKKGKDSKSKKGDKGQAKAYDICDSNNVPKVRATSKLAKGPTENIVADTVEVTPKHLYIVVVGFYDFLLIEELSKIGVHLSGVVELTKVFAPFDFESDDDSGTDSADPDDFWKPHVPSSVHSETEKAECLRGFWRQTYDCLEGDDQCPQYLTNTVHMTVCLPDESFSDETIDDDKHCLSIFADIGGEIIKAPDIKRQHVNYVRRLKIWPIGRKPRVLPVSDFQSYNGFMAIIPPDCSNVSTVLYALIEEVCTRVPDPPQIKLKTPPPSIVSEKQSGPDSSSLLNAVPKPYPGIKSQIADILHRNANVHLFLNPKENDKHDPDLKMDLAMSTKTFLVQEHNELEIMANSYRKLTTQLLDVNIDKLVLTTPILLWKRFPYNEADQQKVLNKIYRLQTAAETLDLPMHELQYFVHTILFNCFSCSNHQKMYDDCNVHSICPKKNVTTTPAVLQMHVPYKSPRHEPKTFEEDDIRVPHAELLATPNLYEAKNLSAYKWYEMFSVPVTVQELYNAERNFLCLDYKYCTFDDSILLRYHNDVDEFGVHTTIWDQSLRTPVDSLREFCRYVIHAEAKWLEEQEEEYIKNFDKDYQLAMEEERKIKEKFYPALVFTDIDFVQRTSIKGKFLEELRRPPVTEEKKGGKKDKGGKSKGGKSDKGKGKGKGKGKDSKGKGKGTVGPVSQIAALEKVAKPTVLPVRRKLSLRCAQPEEPFSFYAYDVSNRRLQLTGSTTVFHSQDGFKVTVDQARFVGNPRKLSLNICINGHSLLLHYNRATFLEPFTFHFALSDRTVIAFTKPLPVPPAEEKLGEKICQTLKGPEDNKKRQEIYFISEKHSTVLKCFNIPYITRKNLILSEDLMVPFLNQLSTRGIRTKLALVDTLSSSEVSKFEETLVESKTRSTLIELSDRAAPSRYVYDVISKVDNGTVKVSDVQVEEEQEQEPIKEHVQVRRSLSDNSSDLRPVQRSNKKLIKKLKTAVEATMPIFKICSSRLHRYQYVKRIKSRFDMPVGSLLKRIPCKPALYKPKIELEISKLLPVKPCRGGGQNTPCYDIRICLPSGLLIQSVEGVEGSPFHIRQRYLDKGPQCKGIAHEFSRTFMRNSSVLIKMLDGNIEVLGVAGQKVKCEIPYLKVKSTPVQKQKCPNRIGNDLIPLHMASLTRFQKQLNRNIKRLQKHLIDGYKSRHFVSHRGCQRWKTCRVQDPDQIYILRSNVGSFKQFSLITSSGNKLKVTPSTILEEQKYYTSTATDYRYQEIFYGREDGTHSILNHESLFVTQFSDGTRLTTWIEIEQEPLIILETEEPIDDVNAKQQQVYEYDLCNTIDVPENSVNDDSITRFSTITFHSESNSGEQSTSSTPSVKIVVDDVGWVSVHLNVKYEHPNYATIIFYGRDNRTDIILPNNVTVTASHKGEYMTNIGDSISAGITTEEILLKSALCSTCFQKSTNRLNIKPLYDKSELTSHELELLRTNDSFRKVFVVNYDGQCFRSKKYNQQRFNQVGCAYHSTLEYQKLFVLTRSLRCCKLWDVDSYRKRIAEAKRNSNTETTEDESSIELRTQFDKHHHEKFLIEYREPMLVLTKYKPKECPQKELAYVTRLVLNNLPPLAKFHQIYSTLLDLSSKDDTIAGSIMSEFKAFLNHIIDDIAGKFRKKSEVKEEEPPPKRGPILEPFHVRYKRWLEECARYWNLIRKQDVPKYFLSKYYLVENSSKTSSDTILVCHRCRKFESDEEIESSSDSLLCECGESCFVSADELFLDTLRAVGNDTELNGGNDTELSDGNEQSDDVQSISAMHFETTVAADPDMNNEWAKTEVGKVIAKEVRRKITKIAIQMPLSEDVTIDKVIDATNLLFSLLKNAVGASTDDDINNSVTTIVDNILPLELNAVELILLLGSTEPGMIVEDMESCRCAGGTIMDQTTSQTSIKHGQVSHTAIDSSYFGIYGHYSEADDVKKPKPIDKHSNLQTVLEKDQSENKIDVVESVPTVEECKSAHPHHHETYLDRYLEKCEQCTQYIPPEQGDKDSYEPERIIQSQSDVIFSGSTVDDTDSYALTDVQTLSNLNMTSDIWLAAMGSDILPNIEVSSDVSLLEYCLSENLSPIDGNTVVLAKNDFYDTESMMVMFSVESLKAKEPPVLGPYAQRYPYEAVKTIVADVQTTANDLQASQNKRKISLEKDVSSALLRTDTLRKCQKCIQRYEDELSRTVSLSRIKTKSVVSLLAALKRGESDYNLSTADKERMTRSLMNIMEADISIKPHIERSNFVSDVDRAIAKDLKLVGSKTVLTAKRAPRQEPRRKTVGSQTQQGVDDKNIQI